MINLNHLSNVSPITVPSSNEFTLLYKVRGHQMEVGIRSSFTVPIHGQLTRVIVDSVTQEGVAIRIENRRGKFVRKYYATSTFINLYKYRMP